MRQLTILTLVALLTLGSTLPAQAVGSEVGAAREVSPLFLNDQVADRLDETDDLEWAAVTPLATSRQQFEMGKRMSFDLQADQGGTVSSAGSGFDSRSKNPGRALMLSAIMPGAGELYAGSTIKAALFFALEVGCWYGAVSYAQRGNDKTTSFEEFADNHWREDIYRTTEYTAAIDNSAGSGFQGSVEEWNLLSWSEKIDYLPGNFTHELPENRNQQFYENIGKYLTQFGFGWDDESGDNPTTAYLWDGSSRKAGHYADMRYEANQFFGYSSTFFSIIMVNHVVSALDAGFTVRKNNRKLAEIEPEVSSIIHNDSPVTVAGLRVRF